MIERKVPKLNLMNKLNQRLQGTVMDAYIMTAKGARYTWKPNSCYSTKYRYTCRGGGLQSGVVPGNTGYNIVGMGECELRSR